ncbi:MAG: copper chaperone PCu(A)C [Pseudomonadota bacterium]
MTFILNRRTATLAIAALTVATLPLANGVVPGALAHDFTAGGLNIDHPWARPTIPNRPTAAYMTIKNAGEADDRLLRASSPAFGRIELHETTEVDGVMTMGKVEGIVAPAGGEAVLAPRGLHIMLFDATVQLAEGDNFPLILSFEEAGDVAVNVMVERQGGEAMEHGEKGHDQSGHGDHGSHATQ